MYHAHPNRPSLAQERPAPPPPPLQMNSPRLGCRALFMAVPNDTRCFFVCARAASGAGRAQADEFIPEHHGRAIHEKYGGPKKLRLFDGDHNSLRPASFLDDGAQFLCEAMGAAPELACPSPPTRRSRLPWSSGGGSRFTYAASDHVDDPELEATLMLSLLDAQSGRGTNNTLRQQLEQQQQQQRQLMGDILMPEPAVAESEIVSKLTELGFTAEEAKEAYQHHKTTEGAVTYLLEKRR